MNYNIKISKEAKNDLKQINYYLKEVLQEIQTANKIMKEIKNNIESLSYFPERYAVVKNQHLSIEKIRKCLINNYMVFYTVEKDKKEVHIARILYVKSNWMKKI